MPERWTETIAQLTPFDWTIISSNLVLVMFAAPLMHLISRLTGHQGKGSGLFVFRGLAIILLTLYMVSILTPVESIFCKDEDASCDPLNRISMTGLTVIISYVVYIIGHALLIKRYGRVKTVAEQEIRYQTYKSEVFTILLMVTLVILVILSILSIWDMENLLNSTSVLGAMVLILFFTKDVWLPDLINGLILLYNNNLEPGSVIRIDKLDLLAISLRTTLIETTFKDLVTGHTIVIPNRQLREVRIDLLSSCGKAGLRQYVDFNIGYEHDADTVIAMLTDVWKQACTIDGAINENVDPVAEIADNGDHAITWRLFYTINNFYRLRPAFFAINRAADHVSRQYDISLQTPVTATVNRPIENKAVVTETRRADSEQTPDD